jgi:hypothetical protein
MEFQARGCYLLTGADALPARLRGRREQVPRPKAKLNSAIGTPAANEVSTKEASSADLPLDSAMLPLARNRGRSPFRAAATLIGAVALFEKPKPGTRHPFSARAEMHAKGACNHFESSMVDARAFRSNAEFVWVAASQLAINVKRPPISLATC